MRRALLLGAMLLLATRFCGDDDDREVPPLAVATFNIENFPKSARQVERAFDEMSWLDTSIIAVQEITDPVMFVGAAKHRLGQTWRFEFVDPGNTPHAQGVLFDTADWKHVKTRVHDDTRLEGSHKPVLDVELVDRAGRHVRVLVVHLKAGGENQPIRQRQLAALGRVITRVKAGGTRVVVAGDFNATGEADRLAIARIAQTTGLNWSSERLACSAFWNRDDGCPRSRLDHVLSTETLVEIKATGACEEDGCGWQDRCPLYAEDVSDHCPVIATFRD